MAQRIHKLLPSSYFSLYFFVVWLNLFDNLSDFSVIYIDI